MKVRLAVRSDVDVLLEMATALHAESRFHVYALNSAKTRASIEKLISIPLAGCILLAESSTGKAAGMLAGYVVDYFFSDTLVAQDRYFYVTPEFRGSSAALKLLIAFRRWAENRRASELCINMSVDVDQPRFDRFMRHMNFHACGSNFVLPLQRAHTAPHT